MSIVQELIFITVGLFVMWFTGYLLYVRYRIFKKANPKVKIIMIVDEILDNFIFDTTAIGTFFICLILVLVFTIDIIRQLSSR